MSRSCRPCEVNCFGRIIRQGMCLPERWCLGSSRPGCARRPSTRTLTPGASLEYSYSFDQELQKTTFFCLFLQARLYQRLRLFPEVFGQSSLLTSRSNGMPLPWGATFASQSFDTGEVAGTRVVGQMGRRDAPAGGYQKQQGASFVAVPRRHCRIGHPVSRL